MNILSRAILSSIAVYVSFVFSKLMHQFEPLALSIVTMVLSLFPMGLGLFWIWFADDITEITICLSMIAISPLLVTAAAVVYIGMTLCLYGFALVHFLLENASTLGWVGVVVTIFCSVGFAWVNLSEIEEDWEMRRAWR